jgi:CheY-like chemotaxis protein
MSQGNRRILLVDDEPSIVEVLSRSLKKLGPGCEVVTATSGQEALARFQQAPFDLLITDVWMPDMDGIALTRAVRTLDADAAIVWLTAYHLSAAEAEGLGIFRHVRKPVTVDVIRDIARAGLASNPRPLIRPSGKRLILVLDDDDSVRRLFGRALASAGF